MMPAADLFGSAPAGHGRAIYNGPVEVRVTPAGPLNGVGLSFTGGELSANEAADLRDELTIWLREVGR